MKKYGLLPTIIKYHRAVEMTVKVFESEKLGSRTEENCPFKKCLGHPKDSLTEAFRYLIHLLMYTLQT